MVVQMVAIGEESGSLDDMLGKVADFYEQEVDNLVDGLSSLLEPLNYGNSWCCCRRSCSSDVFTNLQTRRSRLTLNNAFKIL